MTPCKADWLTAGLDSPCLGVLLKMNSGCFQAGPAQSFSMNIILNAIYCSLFQLCSAKELLINGSGYSTRCRLGVVSYHVIKDTFVSQ